MSADDLYASVHRFARMLSEPLASVAGDVEYLPSPEPIYVDARRLRDAEAEIDRLRGIVNAHKIRGSSRAVIRKLKNEVARQKFNCGRAIKEAEAAAARTDRARDTATHLEQVIAEAVRVLEESDPQCPGAAINAALTVLDPGA